MPKAAQVASKKNREAAQATNTRARRERITKEYLAGKNHTGDYQNRSGMKKANSRLTQQNFGDHNAKYRDLISAFGRVSKKKGSRSGTLSFSAG